MPGTAPMQHRVPATGARRRGGHLMLVRVFTAVRRTATGTRRPIATAPSASALRVQRIRPSGAVYGLRPCASADKVGRYTDRITLPSKIPIRPRHGSRQRQRTQEQPQRGPAQVAPGSGRRDESGQARCPAGRGRSGRGSEVAANRYSNRCRRRLPCLQPAPRLSCRSRRPPAVEWLNPRQVFAMRPQGLGGVIVGLQGQPEARCRAKGAGQTQRRVGGDGALAGADLADPHLRDIDLMRQAVFSSPGGPRTRQTRGIFCAQPVSMAGSLARSWNMAA